MFPGGKMPGEDFINSWYPILIALGLGMVIALRNYFKGGQSQTKEMLKGKTVVVTGANSGMGKELARDFAQRGARVILACRDEEKMTAAISDLVEFTRRPKVKEDSFVPMKLDLASFKSIREFAAKFNKNEERLDILINNAGIMSHPQARTEDDHEIHFQTNHLGPFLLTHLLLDKLKSSAPSRIIHTTSAAYNLSELDFNDIDWTSREFKASDAFADSKLMVVLFNQRLAKELEGSNVTSNVVNPGVVNTEVHRHMPFKQSKFVSITFMPFTWFMMKRAVDGAQSAIQCAVAKEEAEVSGKLYKDCLLSEIAECGTNKEAADKLWDISMELTGLTQRKLRSADKS